MGLMSGIQEDEVGFDPDRVRLRAVLDEFHNIGNDFAEKIYDAISPGTEQLFKMGLTLFFIVMGLKVISGALQGRDAIRQFFWTCLWAGVVYTIFYSHADAWSYTVDPLEDLAIGYAKEIINTAAGMGGAGAEHLQDQPDVTSEYAKLMGMVETQMMRIVHSAIGMMKDGNILTNLVVIFVGLITWFLFGLVALVFGFFLVESQFYFLTVRALLPMFAACAVFPFTRKYASAGFTLIVLAGLTVLAAALAMGFSVGVIEVFSEDLRCAVFRKADVCNGQKPGEVLNVAMLIVTVGFVSLLLHIKSKTIASNISGANDSAAPATLVAAGAKMATLGALGAAGKGSIGNLGSRAMGSWTGGAGAAGAAWNTGKAMKAGYGATRSWMKRGGGSGDLPD